MGSYSPSLDGPTPRENGDVCHESWELHTESADIDGDLGAYVEHQRQIKHYRNLLIRSQEASASSINALDDQLHQLRQKYNLLNGEHERCERGKHQDVGVDQVRSLVKSLDREGRRELLEVVLDASQIVILERYRRSRFDVLGNLGDTIASGVLLYLDLNSLLSLRQVSKEYARISRMSSIWRSWCLRLEPAQVVDNTCKLDGTDEYDWEFLYRRLLQREKHWNTATSQAVQVISSHSNYITSLCLQGDLLISGSYDGDIRFWQIPYGSGKKNSSPQLSHTIHAKPISCLAYYGASKVLVSGYRDDGRIQIWRQVENVWESYHLLSGHSHGIRAVAINDFYAASAGADKCVVIWDWRSGEKITRITQQGLCIGLYILGQTVLSISIEGDISVYSIAQQKMVAQYKLADLVKDCGGVLAEVDVSVDVNWTDIRGLSLVCATKSMIYRLKWPAGLDDGVDGFLPIHVHKVAGTPKTPIRKITTSTVQSARSRTMMPSPLKRTPASSSSFPIITSPTSSKTLPPFGTNGFGPMSSSKSSASPSSKASKTPMTFTSSKSPCRQSAQKQQPSSPSPSPSKKTTSSISLSHPTSSSISENTPSSSHQSSIRFSKLPQVVEVIPVRHTSKVAIGSQDQIVTCTRFAARANSEKEIYISGPNKKVSEDTHLILVPPSRLGGWWDSESEALSLRTPEKNPLSVVVDREKIIYGCSDGSIVLVYFGA